MGKETVLGSYLKNARVKAGLSQADVSEKLGYSTPQFISNWERGASQPPINSLKKLSSIYKIDADSLFEFVLQETIKTVTQDLKRRFKSGR